MNNSKKRFDRNCRLPLSEVLKLYGKTIKVILAKKSDDIKKRKQ
jgi:hypothetical protein